MFNMVYFTNFAYNIYVPKVDGVKIVKIGGEAPSKTVWIKNVEYWAYTTYAPSTSGLEDTEISLEYIIEGKTFTAKFRPSAIFYANTIVSDPYAEDSEKNDSSVAFMDLSPFAFTKSACFTIREALSDAYKVAGELKYDSDKMICYYNTKKYRAPKCPQVVAFPSLENIKARLELLSQLGYIGISYDIMRTPVEWLLLALSMFDSQG